VTAVHEATAEAVARARKGEGPSLIEAKTYRFFGHSRGDPQFGPYRTEAEVKKWRKRDPLILAEKLLKMTNTEKEAHEAAILKEMDEANKFADESPKASLESALEDVYA
jgi:pyruvate dehydrogenase E1 component alpha subunit